MGASPTLAAALSLAERDIPVFPVAGKVPRTPNGLKDASSGLEQVRSWWTTWGDAGIAVPTGKVSGLLVLDVDPDHGGSDSLAELQRKHGPLPETPRCETGGGGEHHYFKHVEEFRNTAGKLGDGLDTRADGGYVVVPPSPHPSGGSYAWDVDLDEAELADPPEWLRHLLRESGNGRARPVSEWRKLAAEGVAPGARNERAAQLAGHLLSRSIDPFVVLELVTAWDAQRNRPPLGRGEVTRTVASISRREAEKCRI